MKTTPAVNPMAPAPLRIASVDLLRGAIMIVMALDHVRDFFSPFAYGPTDLSQASVWLFLTRWITHFCAPTFVFLAGVSAYLYRRNTQCSTGQLQWFLVTRGLWLVFLELTWVSFSWQLTGFDGIYLGTIWSLGWSMVVLALLLYLPFPALVMIAGVIILGHNLLDSIRASDFDGYGKLIWAALHEPYLAQPVPDFFVDMLYPLIPWIGVMAAGYAFARVLELERTQRDALLIRTGLGMIAVFLLLRLSNFYGDPSVWSPNARGVVFSALEVLNTTKYPPSLSFLLMTLGPSLLLMPWLDRWRGTWADRVTVFGRVPFFFYMLHIPLIRLASILWTGSVFGVTALWDFTTISFPEGYEPSLARAYFVWIMVIATLYPLCACYARYKQTHKDKWWLSYL